MKEPQHNEADIFDAALQRPANEREAYLQNACGGNSELRERVDFLLQAHERACGFMSEAAAERDAKTAVLPIPLREKIGDRIGRYKLLQEIGEGGCGVVYMAEQEEPVRRRVALKVIKLGMDTKSVIARFEAERQALALMDHPNIARVLDAGATETGRPYFVMELVRGIKITDFCNENKLSTDQRLQLFIQVCRAVQHAHQKGIIHRDLKPSNVLVTINDNVPVPKVIDFGIAKATNQQALTDKTLFTAFHQLIGTPAYMSPEQAVMTSLDIDTRTDIYSLGVLLYELLTGQTPFDPAELLRSGLDAMRKTIQEQEPVRPSSRLSTLAADALTTIAQHRHTDTRSLIYSVRGDLDWIVMKCLEKDRNRRYESATSLATDLERHLADEPISARPASAAYRLRKMVLRNRLAATATAAVLAALLVGFGAALWSARNASKARELAQQQALKSQEVVRFLEEMLKGVGPAKALGRDTTMLREILDQTVTRLNTLTNQPAVEADLRAILGNIYRDLGEITNSVEMHRRAFGLRQELFPSDNPDVARSLNDLGDVLIRAGEPLEGITLLRQALQMRKRIFGERHLEVADSMESLGEALGGSVFWNDSEPLLRSALHLREQLSARDSLDLAASKARLGYYLVFAGRAAESEQLHREALQIQTKLLGPKHPTVGKTLGQLAFTLFAQRKYNEAELVSRQETELAETLFGKEHPWTASRRSLLAESLYAQGRLAEAESLLRAGVNLMDTFNRLRSQTLLAHIQRDKGELAESEALFREVIANSRWDKEWMDETDVHQIILMQFNWLAGVLRRKGDRDAVDRAYAERQQALLKFHTQAAAVDKPRAWTGLARLLATSADSAIRDGPRALRLAEKAVQGTRRADVDALDTLAAAYAECGHFTDAVNTQREVIALLKSLPSGGPPSAVSFEPEGVFHRLELYESGAPYREYEFVLEFVAAKSLFYQSGHLLEAQALLQEQLEHLQSHLPENHLYLGSTRVLLAEAFLLLGKTGEAEVLSRAALAFFEKHHHGSWWRFSAQSVLGACLVGAGKVSDAESSLISGYEGLKEREDWVPLYLPAHGNAELRTALSRLVGFYNASGDVARAKEWQSRDKSKDNGLAFRRAISNSQGGRFALYAQPTAAFSVER